MQIQEKVQNGEEIDITAFLKNDREDYSSSMSNLGDNLTSGIEVFITDGMKFVSDVVKSLF